MRLIYSVEIDSSPESKDYVERLTKLADVTILSDIRQTLNLWGYNGEIKTATEIYE